jgi:hypothetical protein
MRSTVVDLLQNLCVRFTDVAAYRALLARALCEHGVTLRELENFEASIGALEEAVASQRAYLNVRPGSRFGRKAMSHHLVALAESLDQAGETARAAAAREQARSFWKRRPSEQILPAS